MQFLCHKFSFFFSFEGVQKFFVDCASWLLPKIKQLKIFPLKFLSMIELFSESCSRDSLS